MMAFGDKISWVSVSEDGLVTEGSVVATNGTPIKGWSDKTPVEIMDDINALCAALPKPIESHAVLTLSPAQFAILTATLPKECCDEPLNMAVDPDRCFCIKCKKTVTQDHFNAVLEKSARNTPGQAWKYR
jgi:hypothetical protein